MTRGQINLSSCGEEVLDYYVLEALLRALCFIPIDLVIEVRCCFCPRTSSERSVNLQFVGFPGSCLRLEERVLTDPFFAAHIIREYCDLALDRKSWCDKNS